MRSTSIRILSDGVMKLDGGSVFGQVPRVTWAKIVKTDWRNRITLGLNCLLLQVEGKNILVDTGVGSMVDEEDKEAMGLVSSRLSRDLKRTAGLTPKDIHAVILSHLHFDHSGGCTRMNRPGHLVPTFPQARHFVQRTSWEDACNNNQRCFFHQRMENLLPLANLGQLEMLDGDGEIFSGLNVIVTDGHTEGHQMVMFNHGGERVVFLGDLVPTPHHLNPAVISAFDHSPQDTFEQKQEVLAEAERQGWLLVFSHGHETKAGYLERRAGTTYLRPVQL